MAYGSASGVAALSSQWTNDDGEFDVSTRPTLAQIEDFLDQVSQLMDTALADEGFVTPITIAAVLGEIGLLVNGVVKDLADYSHSTGRFFAEKTLETGMSPFMTVDKELHEWVKRKVVGLETQGCLRINEGRNVAHFEVF